MSLPARRITVRWAPKNLLARRTIGRWPSMAAWFERIPRRLDEELLALEQAGYSFDVDIEAKEAGLLLIRVKYPMGDQEHILEVLFPENYPYCPFEILAPTFPKGRHKNPFNGALCLLKDPLSNWSTEDRLATILATQVRKIAEAHEAPEDASAIEAHEAAQVTGYYGYLNGSVVFTGDWQIPQEFGRGYLLLGLPDGADQNIGLRAAVLEVQDDKRNVLARLDDRIRARYTRTTTGRWLRQSSHPPVEPTSALVGAAKEWRDLETPRFGGAPDVVGLLIPEEIEYQRFNENWIFVVRQKVRKATPKARPQMATYFARADQISVTALQARVPNLVPLFGKKVLVVGLGSIGSMYAWQMARAGIGSMHLIDFDHLQFGNGPRWLLGWHGAGHDKTELLRHYLSEQYPLGTFKAWQHRIGTPPFGATRRESDILDEALEGVDLIFDATAEWCVGHYLSDLAQQRKIPYLWATGTPGARGGAIGRVVPGKTGGCWKCYQRSLGDRTINLPNHAETPEVQPVGCFHATFTGAGCDMDLVTLGAVRLSIATLCVGIQGYPDFNWDIGIVNTWSDEGMPIAPQWKTYKLDRHPDCEEHDDE